MSKYIALKVADTRFAVTCNYPSFTEWLSDRHRGFISPGEPDLRLNIRMDGVPQGSNHDHSLSVMMDEYNHERGELTLSMACSHPNDYFWIMLETCMRCAILAKQPPNLLLHSAGIIQGGKAYLFPGPSGSGKSTICKLLAQDPTFSILHDEVIAIARNEEGFHAWNTPVRGEIPAKYSSGAPLGAIFFLKHDQTNYAIRLSGRVATGLLYLNLITPLVVTNGSLGIKPAESLKLLLALAELIPCYELHFRPEREFWDCVSQLLEKNPQQR